MVLSTPDRRISTTAVVVESWATDRFAVVAVNVYSAAGTPVVDSDPHPRATARPTSAIPDIRCMTSELV
jgi:hypothetical protein